jgi:hypothetical protein
MAQRLIGSEKVIDRTCKSYDHDSRYRFHSSIGKYDLKDEAKFDQLLIFAQTKCTLDIYKQRGQSVLDKIKQILEKYVFRIKEKNNRYINQHLVRITILRE